MGVVLNTTNYNLKDDMLFIKVDLLMYDFK